MSALAWPVSLVTLLCAGLAQAQVAINLPPSADTYVHKGQPTTNFGTLTQIIMTDNSANRRWGFLRFDLSSVAGTLTNVTLNLYGHGPDTVGVTTVTAYPVSDTTWGETSITWNNQPSIGADPIATASTDGNPPRWYTWDITAYVQAERAAGRNVITLALKPSGYTGGFGVWGFNTKENTEFKPYLSGTVDPRALNFAHVDHLNTPRAVYDASQQLRWKWDQQEPFGDSAPNENPASLGAFEMPMRFPGQYFDKETSVSYNYFRDYHASIGRYLQSDPIGLVGGINTYLYAKASSLRYADREGLLTQGEADYLGGLGSKAAKELSEKLIEWLSQPGVAGQDVAAQLCAAYRGGTPRDLNSDCTVGCLDRLSRLQGLGKISAGWLQRCIGSCEKYFVTCNKRAQVCPPDLFTASTQ